MAPRLSIHFSFLFANALRTIPVVLESLHIVSEVAPKAVVLNLTNPAGIVQHAAIRYTNVRMLSSR